jgi:hypothetical protein
MHQDQSNLEKSGTGAATSRRVSRRSSLGALAAMLVVLALTLAGPASAATAPTVSTGGAQSVSYGAAILTGTINPNGANTSYYFQYGPTKLYGLQTSIADAGAGTKTVSVKVSIGGLAPKTEYFYRLVAVSSAVSDGARRDFKTTAVPLSLAILAAPNPVAYGGSVTVQGTLAGTNNMDKQVELQANPFPYTGAWAIVPNVNVEVTNATTGTFTFTVPSSTASTQYRVVTTEPAIPVISPVTTETVSVRVASHVARTKRKGYVRIYGTVTPAENGAQVGILRIAGGRGVLAGGTVLKANGTTTSSSFSRVVKERRGTYRVLARVVNAPVASNYGAFLRIG